MGLRDSESESGPLPTGLALPRDRAAFLSEPPASRRFDRPTPSLDTAFAFQPVRDCLATQFGLVAGELLDPGELFVRQFEPVPPTRFVVASQLGHASSKLRRV